VSAATRWQRVAELEQNAAGMRDERDLLRQRLEEQQQLIQALRGNAEDGARLREEVLARDLELERVTSELDSKKELIRALRRDAEGVDRQKSASEAKDRELEELRSLLKGAEQQLANVTMETDALREAASQQSDETTEIESLRAELHARKTLINSLRADQERVVALRASLDQKQEIIGQLEASINRQSSTIAELKNNADAWRRKYKLLKGESSTAATSVNLPALSENDIRVVEELEKDVGVQTESTITIDMRSSLLEARRVVAQGGES